MVNYIRKFILLFWLISSYALNAQLFINEWMAVNNNVIADGAGEYDDWIEIYNGSSSPIDLAGYYISDDVAEPLKWQIPNSNSALTTIPANGFLLLWADNDTDQGENHLSFKLSADGEPIILTLPDGTTIVDQVLSGPQNDNVSYGRATDGSPAFQFFIAASPGVSNNVNSGPFTYNALFNIPIIQGSDDAEEPVGQSYTTINENVLNIVNDWSGDQTVGIRFQNIPFAQGATINKAHVQFTTAFAFSSVGPSDLTINAELINNSSTFLTSANNITNRILGSQSVNWQPEEWTVPNEANEKEQTPDLTALVQEVIDQNGWSEGNALSFIFSGTGSRIPWSADNPNADYVPRLYLEGELPASTTQIENLVINEIAARGTTYADEFEECDDWIELYNNGNTSVNIGGLFLTDDLDNLTKWQVASPVEIPAGGFQTLWIDKDPEQGGLHASFRLSGSGDQIALVQWVGNDFVILDEVDFDEVPFQSSYGRTTDGGSTWTTFGEITPNASNQNALPWQESPTINLQSGGYNGTQTVSISHPNATAVIYYTIDGSEPNMTSAAYSGPINISENTSLKAKAYAAGFLESETAITSYLIDENLTIPSLFINTDPANFFDDNTGIYVEGTNGTPGFCVNFPANWNQDWEIPVNLSLIEGNGDLGFSVNAGMKIGGGCSRQYGLKSLNVYTRETKYGSEKINYPLFAGRDHDNYERIKLRNSGQDYLRTGFRDGLLHSLLWDKVDLELQGFQPSVVYLNGDFWGVLNIRERYTDEYFETNLDLEKDEIDLIKNPGLDWEEVKLGSNDDYRELFDFFETNDFSIDANYNQATEMIDFNSFISYWASMIYATNGDWPANNLTVWKEKQVGAKWRYMVADQDNSSNSGFNPQNDTDFNTLEQVTDPSSVNWPNHQNSTLTFRKLLENENFRNEYVQRTCSFIHLIYGEERTHHMIDSFQMMIDPYMEEHINKWNADNAYGGNYFNWTGWVQEFRNFFTDRPAYMRDFINDEFNLNGTYELLLNYDVNTGGTVRINSNQMETPYNYTGLYFKGVPVEVTAIAKPNYTFAYWLETGETTPTINFVANENATLTPIFQTTFAVNIGADTSLCQGSSLSLDATIAGCDCDYEWFDGSMESALEFTVDAAGTYAVTVTDNQGGSAVGEITVSFNPAPMGQATPLGVSCSNGSDGAIDLTVSGGVGGYTYLWNNGSQEEDLSGLSTGSYTVTITGQNGCSSTVENIFVPEPAPLEVVFFDMDANCADDATGSIDLTVSAGTPPYSYNWSNNTSIEDQANLTPGNYAVTITDAEGCSSVYLTSVSGPSPIDVNVTTNLPQGGTNNGSIQISPFGGIPPYSILWMNGSTSTVLSNLGVGIYTALITDANGCTYEEVVNFFPTSSTEPGGLLSFNLMPNPATHSCQIHLELIKKEDFELSVYNLMGQLIERSVHKGQENNIGLNVEKWNAGIYIIALSLENGTAYRRLVVE